MDRIYHIKQLRKALANRDCNNYENYMINLREELKGCGCDDEDDAVVMSLLDFTVEFLNPLQRFLVHVGERIREENVMVLEDWSSELPASHEPLTIQGFFVALTESVSQGFAHYVIDHINASSVIKSDLIDAVENGDFESFNAIIRGNDIDYADCSRVMAIVTAEVSSKEIVQNGMAELFDCDEDDDEEYYHQLCVNFDFMAEHMAEFLRREGVEDEEIARRIEILTEFYDEINGCYRDDKFREGLIIESYLYFVNFVDQLRGYYVDGRLLESDIEIISHFVEQKRREFPAVNGYFKCYTKGDFICEGFEVVDDCDFDRVNDFFIAWFAEHSPVLNVCKSSYTLPPSLDVLTPEGTASDIFRRAIDVGFITVGEDGTLSWGCVTSLLDYFCGVVFCGDCVEFRDGEYIWSRRGELRLPTKQLNALFGNRYNIGEYRKHQIGRKTPPQNYGSVDALMRDK